MGDAERRPIESERLPNTIRFRVALSPIRVLCENC